ncbi:KaiC/GvpD/RAD55 family RecA-like ATPase [Natrinema hispanicum]|uniref:KaiC/GvpD/RAD55 family RecA-like ATPase n=1 Tax=Natrinema hispanicum TaxID=392421 RepID=A0A482Y2Q2_9EURY|nr:ATPase domain-containing protein [Natrinema hispanicum]RZV06322.1 KaiC/GvpD/RAD55 family RecA-like ATPase [Natrinema hispanicum]
MAVSTGIEKLDEILDGGFQENRTVLVTGPPGAGKSTLAMNFLQAGLENDEHCTYISTEQTPDELRDTFEPFSFDLTDELFTVLSLHARPGSGTDQYDQGTIVETYGADRTDDDVDRHLLRTLEGADEIDDHYIDFTPANLREFFRCNISGDRVVVDSISGLRSVSENEQTYRRFLLDLIQLINDHHDATALFTAESSRPNTNGMQTGQFSVDELTQYNLHGVIRLQRNRLRGTDRRLLEILKMRGVAYDDRTFELMFDDEGIRILPENRTFSSTLRVTNHVPTGIDGLDTLLGGGILSGESTVVQHDGKAEVGGILYVILSNILKEERSIALLPRINSQPLFLQSVFERLGTPMDDLLDDDRLFVFDHHGVWDDHQNIFKSAEDESGIKSAMTTIHDRSRSQGVVLSLDTNTLRHMLGEETTRQVRSWLQSSVVTATDAIIDIHNPALLQDDLAAFHVDLASQLLETWMNDTGLQYVQLHKSPTGDTGAVRLIEYLDKPPYVRVVT